MDKPKIITLDGKEHVAKRAKARYFERASTFDVNILKDENPAMLYANFIAEAFDDVSADDVLDALYVDELRMKCTEIIAWLFAMSNQKISEVPNAASQVSHA